MPYRMATATLHLKKIQLLRGFMLHVRFEKTPIKQHNGGHLTTASLFFFSSRSYTSNINGRDIFQDNIPYMTEKLPIKRKSLMRGIASRGLKLLMSSRKSLMYETPPRLLRMTQCRYESQCIGIKSSFYYYFLRFSFRILKVTIYVSSSYWNIQNTFRDVFESIFDNYKLL